MTAIEANGMEGDEERDWETRSRRPRRTLPSLVGVLLIALLALAVGCSDSSATPETTGAAGDIQVRMVDMAFVPETVTVPVGGSVTWANEDSVSHNAVADDGSWKTEIFGKDGSVTLTFDTPGTYTYICTLHPNMTGTVIVE